MDSILKVECSDSILWITLNRPDKGNALTPEMLIQLEETLKGQEDNCRVAVLTGEGERHFCGGYDLDLLAGMVKHSDESTLDDNPFQNALKAIAEFARPVIAMLNGHAVGGGLELAVSCDLRIAARGAQCSMPPARLGILYSPTGLKKFVDLMGVSRTKDLFFTARPVKDEEALRIGLIDHLVPRGELTQFTRDMALTIAGNAPLVVTGTKWILEVLRRQGCLNPQERQQCNRMRIQCFLSQDLQEGQTAFLEKRKALFKGK